MDKNDGDGDGNPYVSIETFDQFKVDQASLCNAYRNHFETKVTNMNTSIKWTVAIVGTVSTLIITLFNYALSLGLIG